MLWEWDQVIDSTIVDIKLGATTGAGGTSQNIRARFESLKMILIRPVADLTASATTWTVTDWKSPSSFPEANANADLFQWMTLDRRIAKKHDFAASPTQYVATPNFDASNDPADGIQLTELIAGHNFGTTPMVQNSQLLDYTVWIRPDIDILSGGTIKLTFPAGFVTQKRCQVRTSFVPPMTATDTEFITCKGDGSVNAVIKTLGHLDVDPDKDYMQIRVWVTNPASAGAPGNLNIRLYKDDAQLLIQGSSTLTLPTVVTQAQPSSIALIDEYVLKSTDRVVRTAERGPMAFLVQPNVVIESR